MLRIGLKSVLAHKRRLLGTLFAVFLGVAFLSGTLVFGDTAAGSFDDLFTEGNAGTDAVVRGDTVLGTESATQRSLLDAELLASVAEVEGVAAAEPVIEALGQVIGADGEPIGGNGPPTIAGNWIDHPDLNPYVIVDGRAPAAPGEVVVNRGAALAGGLEVGSRTVVRSPELIDVEVVGIATYGSADGLSDTTFTAFTLDAARDVLLGGADRLSAIRVQSEDGVSEGELVDRLEPLLPQGAEAITATDLTAEQNEEVNADFLGWFEMFLLVFSGIALLVATFTIHNTFAIILAQRTRESALLRAVGASRGQVLRSMALESLLIGVVSSTVGIAAGIGIAWTMKGFVDATSLVIETGSLVVALVVGVVVTLVAGLVPAIRASRVAPIAALRDQAVERTAVSWIRVVIGAVLTVSGVGVVLAAALGDGDDGLGAVGLASIAVVAGLVVLGPVFAGLAASVIGSPLPALRGVSGSLARLNARRNPRRTAGTATALMIGVCVVTLFTVFAASAKSSIDATLAGSFTGDFVIINDAWSGVGFDLQMAEDLAALPEIDVTAGGESAAVVLDGDEMVVSVADTGALSTLIDFDVSAGSFADLAADEIAVSERFAEDEGVTVGSVVSLGFADGATTEVGVGAVFGMADLTGPVIIPVAAWEPHAGQRMHNLVLMSVADGVDPAAGRTAVETVAERYGAGEVQDRAEYVESVSGQLDQLLTVVYGLLALSIVIALMGIGNTLSLSIHERTSELGLLRAVGQTRSQLRTMVRWESVIIAVFGTVGGVGLGVFLAWGLVQALAAQGLGAFAAPVPQLGVVLLAGALVGVLAGLRPARRAARLDILEAIRVE